MKYRFAPAAMAAALLLGSLALAQTVTHNTWTSGAPMPAATVAPVAAVLQGQIYVVGGGVNGTIVADVNIYNPTTNSWTAGVPLPVPTGNAAAAVVNNVLYIIGGDDSTNGSPPTNAVWAYSPRTKKWSSKAAMPTARNVEAAVVENKLIYVIGGWDGVFSGNGLATVEAYNPATDSWTEENPLLIGRWAPSAGLFGTTLTGFTIVASGGAEECCPTAFTGDTEGYSPSTNTWTTLNADPNPRGFACYGMIGQRLFVAGGNDTQGPALNVTESYMLSKNTWKTLAPIPQATIAPASTVYKGRLYCFGGWTAWNGLDLSNVQIYQP